MEVEKNQRNSVWSRKSKYPMHGQRVLWVCFSFSSNGVLYFNTEMEFAERGIFFRCTQMNWKTSEEFKYSQLCSHDFSLHWQTTVKLISNYVWMKLLFFFLLLLFHTKIIAPRNELSNGIAIVLNFISYHENLFSSNIHMRQNLCVCFVWNKVQWTKSDFYKRYVRNTNLSIFFTAHAIIWSLCFVHAFCIMIRSLYRTSIYWIYRHLLKIIQS